MSTPPSLLVAVRLDRERQPNVWEDWRFALGQVAIDDGSAGVGSRVLSDDGRHRCMLFTGLPVSLHPDEAEGYYLNLSSGSPCWFVMWRVDDDDPSQAWPERVTLSYHEAGRLLDAQERVDNLPLPPAMCELLADYTAAHHRPEVKQRRRPQSFRAPDER